MPWDLGRWPIRLVPSSMADMPLERAVELALERLEIAEQAGDYVAAVYWADALDRVIARRNAKLGKPRDL